MPSYLTREGHVPQNCVEQPGAVDNKSCNSSSDSNSPREDVPMLDVTGNINNNHSTDQTNYHLLDINTSENRPNRSSFYFKEVLTNWIFGVQSDSNSPTTKTLKDTHPGYSTPHTGVGYQQFLISSPVNDPSFAYSNTKFADKLLLFIQDFYCNYIQNCGVLFATKCLCIKIEEESSSLLPLKSSKFKNLSKAEKMKLLEAYKTRKPWSQEFVKLCVDCGFLLLTWWVIAGFIVIEYKVIGKEFRYPFFFTGLTNLMAGGILIVLRFAKTRTFFLTNVTKKEGWLLALVGVIAGLEYSIANR